ncbi:hypothetical protein CHS0354_010282, partial [Potamilus streckersoni]
MRRNNTQSDANDKIGFVSNGIIAFLSSSCFFTDIKEIEAAVDNIVTITTVFGLSVTFTHWLLSMIIIIDTNDRSDHTKYNADH